VVIDETIRYADGLRRLGLTIAAVVVEALPLSNTRALAAVNESLGQIAGGDGLFAVAKITPPPQGLAEAAE